MVETITPVVHGSRNGYRASVAAHLAGAGISSATVGLLLGGAGAVLGAPWGITGEMTVATLAVATVGLELAGISSAWLCLRRQVPEWWRTFYGPVTAAFLYGLGLGVGFYTHLRSATWPLVAIAVFGSGGPLVGAAVCLPFGVARGLSVLISRTVEDEEGARSALAGVERLSLMGLPRALNGLAAGSVALAAAAAALGL